MKNLKVIFNYEFLCIHIQHNFSKVFHGIINSVSLLFLKICLGLLFKYFFANYLYNDRVKAKRESEKILVHLSVF